MIYIYELIHPISKEVRYIGQTSNPRIRLNSHCRGNKSRKTHTTNWIQSLLDVGLKPEMVIFDICDKSNSDIVEQKHIREYKEKGYNLTNHSIGGHSSLGCKHSLESRLKRSIESKGRKCNYSEESLKSKKLKHSEYLKNNPNQRIDNILSKEERYKAALKGNKIASEKLSKIVIKIKDGKIIKKYNSIKEASLDNNKIAYSTLAQYCNGTRKQKSQIYFKYLEDIKNLKAAQSKNKK